MPEILTKHPDVVLKILKESGLQCGTGTKPQILTTCPADRFCQLPTGELCIYGMDNISSMTQIHPSQIKGPGTFSVLSYTVLATIFIIFAAGIIIGLFMDKK